MEARQSKPIEMSSPEADVSPLWQATHFSDVSNTDDLVAIPFDELPRNEWGEIVIDAIPGLRPERPATPDAIEAAARLGTIRDQILNTQPLDEMVIAIPDLPGLEGGPLPIDSEHPDPERTSRDSVSSELPPPELLSPAEE